MLTRPFSIKTSGSMAQAPRGQAQPKPRWVNRIPFHPTVLKFGSQPSMRCSQLARPKHLDSQVAVLFWSLLLVFGVKCMEPKNIATGDPGSCFCFPQCHFAGHLTYLNHAMLSTGCLLISFPQLDSRPPRPSLPFAPKAFGGPSNGAVEA